MMKISNPIKIITDFLRHSIQRVFIVTLLATFFIPLAFLAPNLSASSWDSIYQDNLQKQKLLATGLVEPIQLKVASYQHELKLLDISLQAATLENSQQVQSIIDNFTKSTDDVVAVSLLLTSNKSSIIGIKESIRSKLIRKPTMPTYVSEEIMYRRYNNENSISPIFKSGVAKRPVILIKHHLYDAKRNKLGTLFAELETKYIQNICAQVKFGNKGSCTIIDNKGKTIAHPNPTWVSQSRSLSKLTLVKELRKNNAGYLEYLSTNNNAEMIGGYAKIKNLDWGIMVSRPKAEISLPINNIIIIFLVWLIAGLITALFLAIFITVKVTRPLNILAKKSNLINKKTSTYQLEQAPKGSSSEVRMIWNTLSNLLMKYQELNLENDTLKSSTKKDIRFALSNIREKNIKKPHNIDPLTGITNGRCFVEELRKNLTIHHGEITSIILIEVNNYKSLIAKDNVGLAEHIIKHVAKIISGYTRNDDIVARYGNAGRFAVLANNCSPKALQGTAKKIRSIVEVNPIQWKDDTVYINLSIGLVGHKINDKTTVKSLMSFAEQALTKSRSVGENKISTYKNKVIEVV